MLSQASCFSVAADIATRSASIKICRFKVENFWATSGSDSGPLDNRRIVAITETITIDGPGGSDGTDSVADSFLQMRVEQDHTFAPAGEGGDADGGESTDSDVSQSGIFVFVFNSLFSFLLLNDSCYFVCL